MDIYDFLTEKKQHGICKFSISANKKTLSGTNILLY